MIMRAMVLGIYSTIAALSSKAVLINLSLKFDEFLAAARNSTAIIASIFMRKHVVNPRPLDRFLRSIVLCFLRIKIINNVAFRQLICLCCSFRVRRRHRSMEDYQRCTGRRSGAKKYVSKMTHGFFITYTLMISRSTGTRLV